MYMYMNTTLNFSFLTFDHICNSFTRDIQKAFNVQVVGCLYYMYDDNSDRNQSYGMEAVRKGGERKEERGDGERETQSLQHDPA